MIRGLEVNVKIATRKDIKRLINFEEIVAKVETFNGKWSYLFKNKKMMEYYLRNKGLFVAECKAEIIGFILTHIVEWMHGSEKLIWIEDIVTHPEYRKKGVAKELIKFTKKHYIKNCKTIYAEIHPDNYKSLSLFKGIGSEMVERILAYHKK